MIDDTPSRMLLVLDRNRDGSFTGFMVERGRRMPVASVELNPELWMVRISLQSPEGNANLELTGFIENLGSARERTIAGRWREGGKIGDFRLVIN